MENYLALNKELWNQRVGIHLQSEFYDVENFLKGKVSLSEIEVALLPDMRGKSVLHLQCHFGLDAISMSRMGAEVTGIDFSESAIAVARELAQKAGQNTEFICSDVYELPNVLDEKFDIVFTSFGVIGWLPDINKWAGVVAHFLKPGGQFIFAEFHPVVWMFDDHFKSIMYNYFQSDAIIETEKGTYADKDAELEMQSVSWNHSLSSVVQRLYDNGVRLLDFREYDYSPYNCFNETIEILPGRFQIRHLAGKIPMAYSIIGSKPGDLL